MKQDAHLVLDLRGVVIACLDSNSRIAASWASWAGRESVFGVARHCGPSLHVATCTYTDRSNQGE